MKNSHWTKDDSAALYGVHGWANDYFSINESGCVTAKTLNTEVSLLDIVKGMQARGLEMPVLLRIENVLDAQLFRLNEAFKEAIANANYENVYRGVYPIKVNQQAQVVEEVADFGSRYQHGLEVGSKPELIAALAMLSEPDSLIICNGYKDSEFIELGLHASRLGFNCFFVVETPSELPLIIDASKKLGISPKIGMRIKMTSTVSGYWNSTSGDRSIFGLTSPQVIELVDALKQENMLECLQLLHCHLGSQIPNIRDIRGSIVEACRYFADIQKEGANLTHIDLGGGLAVDYTGAQSSDSHSMNYNLHEYCNDIVITLKETLDKYGLAHPVIVTESGRATVAYSSVLLFNILDVNRFEAVNLTSPSADEHSLIKQMREIYDYLEVKSIQECYNDAQFYRQEIRDLYKRGQVNLRQRAIAENIYLDVMQKIASIVDDLERIPADLEGLKESLSDIYYGNFSLFQSLPDIWAIEQIFPVMPIHRLDEKPERQAVIADITCDCDGKIDRFISPDGTYQNTLPLHELNDDEDYYLGVFLVGAYQETLGDLHNLFGDTNVVSVRINADKSIDFVKEIHGDTIADVLSYVEYQPKDLQIRYRNTAERAVKNGLIDAKERQQIIKAFNESIQGYTYYEK